jgi:hypothetical protein
MLITETTVDRYTCPRADPGRGRTRRPHPPPKIGKNMIFWRKIVIFHTKYPNNFRAFLSLLTMAQLALSS